jgi:hypothetical protein
MENVARDEYGNWRFLPFSGGVMDQPEWLMHDLLQLKHAARRFERQLEKKRKADRGNDGRG